MIIFPPFHVKTTMTLDYLNSTLNNNFIFDVCISEQDVIDIISIIQVNKAVGPDNISHKMLKNTMYTITKPLCTLFNRSLRILHTPGKSFAYKPTLLKYLKIWIFRMCST